MEKRKELFRIATRHESNFKWRYFDPEIDRRNDRQIDDSKDEDKREWFVNYSDEKESKNMNDYATAFQIFVFILSIVGLIISIVTYYQIH